MHAPPPRNRLWLPRADLGRCVAAVVSRDTRGCGLSARQRLTHLSVSPLCALSWRLLGTAERFDGVVDDPVGAPRLPVPGPVLFSGPRTRPESWWNPDETHVLFVLFWPDAVQALTGLEPRDLLDRDLDAAACLPADWTALLQAVWAATDDEHRVALIEDFLGPRWRARRPAAGGLAAGLSDWLHALALRAHGSGAARSLRQAERRVRLWAGLPLRELRLQARLQRSFFRSLRSYRQGRLRTLSDVAAGDGFADQSHLTRETRRATGFTPAQLRRRFFDDEAFWLYRLWEEAAPEPR